MSRIAHPRPDGADGLAIAVRARGETKRPPSTHPCASCGLCCHTYIVPLSGADLHRIVRSLDLAPGDVSIAWRETDPGQDRFRLEPDGQLYSLALEKRTWSRQQSPCVFLMRLPGGQDRCGIYGLRPAACRAYPMLNVRGAVALRDDPLCPPGARSEERRVGKEC